MDSPPATQERARIMRQSAERGAALLRRILMFARGTDPALAPLDLGQSLRETVAIAGKLLGAQISLEVDVPEDLPVILGDSSQVHQVLMNLCVNARDAMPEGGRLVLAAQTVTLGDEAHALGPDAVPGEFVTVSVRDTGVGIPAEIRDKLFDPFFTTKARETATGLGLATVLRVMRRHQGFIAYESQVGDGTCFTCYFPALPDPSLISKSQVAAG
jgi:signal transduction histidine kinase